MEGLSAPKSHAQGETRQSEHETAKSWGQFATPLEVARFMVGLIGKGKGATVLDPCTGSGVFPQALLEAGFANVVGVEIDPNLASRSPVPTKVADFLASSDEEKFDVIIGNPPYVRWRNIPRAYSSSLRGNPKWVGVLNGLGDLSYPFIIHSVQKLAPGGELILITPVFWTETLHSAEVRRSLATLGELDLMLLLGEARIFQSVASTFLIFKFVRQKRGAKIRILDFSSTEFRLEDLQLARDVLHRLLTQPSVTSRAGMVAYRQPQFTGDAPWKPIPPEVRTELSSLEAACALNPPVVSVAAGRKVTRIPVTRLFSASDLSMLGVPTESCTSVSWNGQRRYLVPADERASAKGETSHFSRYVRLGDIADIGNGLVSGCDSAFRVDSPGLIPEREQNGLVGVVKARCLQRLYHDDPKSYIFLNSVENESDLASLYPVLLDHLLKHRMTLEKRYQYGREIPWWHWVFLRNFKLISTAREMIVTPCKERFNRRHYVRFALVSGGLLVTQDVTAIVPMKHVRENIRYLLALLSSNQTYLWLLHKGLSRGGVQEFSEEPLSRIPIPMIDWNESVEIRCHDAIVELVESAVSERRSEPYFSKIQNLIDSLYASRRRPKDPAIWSSSDR